jgi:hypothetical protein
MAGKEKPITVVSPEEARRQEWDEHVRQDTAWQKEQEAAGNLPCPDCGAYKGYNPVTGVQVRTQIGRELIEGHRDSCPRNVSAKGKKAGG